jgi:hypothetical protein
MMGLVKGVKQMVLTKVSVVERRRNETSMQFDAKEAAKRTIED